MAFTIPFYRTPGFRPKTAIRDNETSDTPVEFELSMAAGPDHARLKSLLSATIGLTSNLAQWTPEMQRAVVEALRTSGDLFVATVGAIKNLTAPAVLCRRVAIRVDEKAKDDDPVPIENGVQFSRVASYMPTLALEVGFEVQRLTAQGAIDPRFFDSPSASPASAANPNGSATPARTLSGDAATAGSAT